MKDIADTMGPLAYYIRVNEFQKHGLPHSHIAVSVKVVPRTPNEIDKILSAELPRSPGPLRDAVKRHMTHNHDRTKPYHRCGWPSKKCQYNFPKPIQQESQFNDRGYFEPRRRHEEDANISRTRQRDNHQQEKPVDEIKDYERGRYLSSIEAATRIAHFTSLTESLCQKTSIHLPVANMGKWQER
ncbi:hypothetical protein B0H17DRAFT_1151318 [Mycena rosella]|uniref:Helitron helicase-like domain-containing protein n=1 Tax=Mycena rosella TaxID=1033263 RepID=A0AAD7BKV3_MYCRO|nr:hypothetical protein B0H17DRAFT_1151318 [Mycena rosella]